LRGESKNRIDSVVDSGIEGSGGTGSVVQNVWFEHVKVGWWVPGGSHIRVQNCRFRNTFADGINLCNGGSNTNSSIVTNNHFRGTGDDSIAVWSPKFNSATTGNFNNTVSFNTIEAPWRANGIAIYGGSGNSIVGNLIVDTADYPGIFLAMQFNSFPFTGTIALSQNRLVRCGGKYFAGEYGALVISADESVIRGISIVNTYIVESTYSGVLIAGAYDVLDVNMSKVVISNPNKFGIESITNGIVNCFFVNVTNPKLGGVYAGPKHVTLNKQVGNQGI